MTKDNTFWEHLEVFRWMIVRVIAVTIGVAIAVFCFKDYIFNNIILSPCRSDFITYSVMCRTANLLNIPELCPQMTNIKIINIDLAAQLFIHISISFYIGLIIAFPYLMIELWIFSSPALYKNERKPAIKGILSFMLLFFLGVAIAYFLIFPLTLNFLGTYQVSEFVDNQISLRSYISTFLTLIFMIGVVFEMPIVAYFFARIGLLSSMFLIKNRKYAVVIVLIISALITPSTDVFTMLLVTIPLQLLYELSCFVVKRVENKHKNE